MGLNLLAWAALAYFVGALPIDYIIVRLFGPSRSHPLDKTNVLSFLIEVAKGAALAWLAAHYAWSAYGMTVAGVAVVAGASFSFWQGKRGSATLGAAVGALAVAVPLALIAVTIAWALVFVLVRQPDTVTLVAASLAPLAAALLHDPPAALLMALGVCVVVFASVALHLRHSGNLVQ